MRVGRLLGLSVLLASMLFCCAQDTLAQRTRSTGGSAPRAGLALVIGNSRYAQGDLPSVDEDRKAIAGSLRSIGFTVRERENLRRPSDFEDELSAFLRDENAATEDTLIVYYSGHGLQLDGRPYILGTGLPPGDTSNRVREFSEDLGKLIGIMEDAAPSARVLIVDACRNNTFSTSARRAGPAFRQEIGGTYLLFADAPGKTVPARSESTLQSPFTAGLLYALENSSGGIEERFQIAKAKTRQLNPDQNPELQKSDTDKGANRSFVDKGNRSTPVGQAGRLLDEAEEFYRSGSWDSFEDRIAAARILSTEPALNVRLDAEQSFANLVTSAQAAEGGTSDKKWAESADSWQKAGALFPARVWVLERAAVDWLMADELAAAARVIGHLMASGTSPLSQRAEQMLASLVRYQPSLGDIAKEAGREVSVVMGPEFEKYVKKQQ